MRFYILSQNPFKIRGGWDLSSHPVESGFKPSSQRRFLRYNNMSISIQFDGEIPSSFRHAFVNTIFKQLNQNAAQVNANIKNRIKESIRDAMLSSPEIRGPLKSDVSDRLTNIINVWTNNINIISNIGRSPDPLLTISVGILRAPHTDTPYEFLGFSTIEWLRWLMLESDKTIATYHFVRDSDSPQRITMERKGRAWTIPPEVRDKHNFALHIFPEIEEKITSIIKSEVENEIGSHCLSSGKQKKDDGFFS